MSGLPKWRQTSRLTLLLPHGYEGNGPEHSSARLERFLQLAAQENIRIVNATTSAQYFHLLRRQALDPNARPLVVMTPKGLLRLKEAASTLSDLASGSFAPVLDDPNADRERVRRLVVVSGKLYYDIAGHEARAAATSVAVARIEQLYPFPVGATEASSPPIPRLEEVVWAQEEPQNMGAWRAIRHRLEDAVGDFPLRYVGRPWRASTSEGYPDRASTHAGPDRPGRPGGAGHRQPELAWAWQRRKVPSAFRESGARAPDQLTAPLVAAPLARRSRQAGPVRARLGEDALAVLGRDSPPDVERGQREPERAHAAIGEMAQERHAPILIVIVFVLALILRLVLVLAILVAPAPILVLMAATLVALVLFLLVAPLLGLLVLVLLVALRFVLLLFLRLLLLLLLHACSFGCG